MYRNLGLDLPGCAQLLHVTERTLHNWQSGKHDIPFAAYKLLRLLNRMELPGESWAGWCFHGGKLWTPEGRSFVGADGSWWSLLVRRAAMFDRVHSARGTDAARPAVGMRSVPAAGGEASSPPAQAGGRREAPALDLSIGHISTVRTNPASFYGPVAINFEPANAPAWCQLQGAQL
ncbi:hypothetical protein AVMA1855_26065 [Acidovorax sp. SUPP1855]|uniref:VC1465 family Xer recombination activation factor n=1 Tax=Acidovorax sp. SUPP1855 TaxID=431774 RepID=UPI0023DE2A19|nr:VC1465 family Xer recombination activation factor [Acidovorax sp. SUPP1855]GKS87687.1 hypothetical protein AVMA1855_26065 [Acidovorax sp. SUPP1855]